MAERDDADVLRELFIRIGLDQSEETQRDLDNLRQSLEQTEQSSSRFAETFAGSLAAIATSGFFNAVVDGFVTLASSIKATIDQASDLAAIQEDADASLASALKLSGQFSDAAFTRLKEGASELQNLSRFGDELIQQGQAAALGFGATVDQAQQTVQVAADLSAAFNKPFEESIRQVSRTFGGFAGELGELVPELKDLTREQLLAGDALDVLAAKYGGSAVNQLNTFAAANEQLENTIGDSFELFGAGINEALVPSLRNLNNTLEALGPTFSKVGKDVGTVIDIFNRFIDSIFPPGDNSFLSDLIEGLGDDLVRAALLIEDFFNFLLGRPSLIGGLLGTGGLDKIVGEVADKFKSVFSSITGFFEEAFDNINIGFLENIDTFVSDRITSVIDKLIAPGGALSNAIDAVLGQLNRRFQEQVRQSFGDTTGGFILDFLELPTPPQAAPAGAPLGPINLSPTIQFQSNDVEGMLNYIKNLIDSTKQQGTEKGVNK